MSGVEVKIEVAVTVGTGELVAVGRAVGVAGEEIGEQADSPVKKLNRKTIMAGCIFMGRRDAGWPTSPARPAGIRLEESYEMEYW